MGKTKGKKKIKNINKYIDEINSIIDKQLVTTKSYSIRHKITNDITWHNTFGFYHHIDGPAVERSDGTKEWWVNGKPHRKNGPAVEYSDGQKLWFDNGKHHRIDGPAKEWLDDMQWYLNGNQHSDGPAANYSFYNFITPNVIEWWVFNKFIECNTLVIIL